MIRCTDKKTESILGFPLKEIKELDYHVDRILSRSQSKKQRLQPEKEADYRYVCKDVPMDYITAENLEYTLSLRVIRIEVTPGCFENLITQKDLKSAEIFRIHDGRTVLDVEGLIDQNIEAVRPGRTFAHQQRFKHPLSFCYRN